MDLFEFYMILLSVVIGLALSEFLTGTANLIRTRRTVKLYWLHIFFQVAVFIALFQQWWESWELRYIPELTVWAVLTLLASPLLLFLLAHLLYPRVTEGVDLKDYYFRQASILWWIVVAGMISGTLIKPLSLNFNIFQMNNLSGFLTIPVCIILASTKNQYVHQILAPLVLGIEIFDTLLAGLVISDG